MTKKKALGITSASMVALFQGLEGVIFTFFGLVISVAAIFTTTSFSVASIFLREIFVVVGVSIVFWPYLQDAFKRLFRKEGKFLIMSGLFTSTGDFFYVLSFTFAGSSFGPVLTTMYPIFSLILLRIIFKEHQNAKVWAGVALSIISGLLFMLLPSVLLGTEFNVLKFVGMLCGMIAAALWAMEGMLIKKAFDKSTHKPLANQEILILRSFSSLVVSTAILIPIGFIPFYGEKHNPFDMIGKIITDWRAILIIISMAFSVLSLRLFHANAIKKIGPKLTAIIDTNNFIVPAFLALFISIANPRNVVDNSVLFETFTWWLWLLIIPLAVGVYMVLYFEKSNEDMKKITLDRYIE